MTTVEDSLTGGEATNALDKIRRVGNRHKTARSLRKAEERARELLMQDTQRKVDQVMTSVMSDLGLMKESSEMRSLTSRVRHSPLQSGSKEYVHLSTLESICLVKFIKWFFFF